MRKILCLIVLPIILFVVGCKTENVIKYQCVDGAIVESPVECEDLSCPVCPDLNCSECPKQIETETKEIIKYQCYDGSVEEKFIDCDEPEPIIYYQCQDGTIKDSENECDIIEVSEPLTKSGSDIVYKYDNYLDYSKNIRTELETRTGVEGMGLQGDTLNRAKYGGSVYFVTVWKDSWGELHRYWAVQVNAETGKLIRYKEISGGSCSDFKAELWWPYTRVC